MNDTVPVNQPRQNGPVDGLDLWASESPSQAAAALSVVRLDQNETLIIPFTVSMARHSLHFVDSQHLRSYAHCLGAECLLCRLGYNPETRDLLPVYDPVAKTVAVLAITPNVRPMALRPQLGPVLQRVRSGERLLVGIRKIDNTRFSVSASILPDDADCGELQISDWMRQFESGAIDLKSVYPRLDATELAAIPEIASRMTLKGITIS